MNSYRDVSLPDQPVSSHDAQLLAGCRSDRPGATVEFYRAHWDAVLSFALRLASSSSDAEDIAATAFVKSLAAVRRGGGPRGPIRPYLCRAVRTAAADFYAKPVALSDDIAVLFDRFSAPPPSPPPHHELAVEALAALPRRWRVVLWHAEVERLKPREIAPLMELTPNGVSALLKRARAALRQAYLALYLSEYPDHGCGRVLRLIRPSAAPATSLQEIEAHLQGCKICPKVLRKVERSPSLLSRSVGSAVAAWLLTPAASIQYMAALAAGSTGPAWIPEDGEQRRMLARFLAHTLRPVGGVAAAAVLSFSSSAAGLPVIRPADPVIRTSIDSTGVSGQGLGGCCWDSIFQLPEWNQKGWAEQVSHS